MLWRTAAVDHLSLATITVMTSPKRSTNCPTAGSATWSPESATPFVIECLPIGIAQLPTESFRARARVLHSLQNHTDQRDPLGRTSNPQQRQSSQAWLKS